MQKQLYALKTLQHRHKCNSWHTYVLAVTQTHTLSSRQQGPVSNHGREWICSVLRANDLRHMSSPCEFKTKRCQKRSALAGQRHLCSAVLHMQRATQSSKSKMRPIIILLRRPVLCPCRLLQTVCAAPISAAAADLPARLEWGPRHPGDSVHSHYPVWKKLFGRPGVRRSQRGGEEERKDSGAK